MFDFLKAIAMGQELLNALKLLAAITQANTEATEKHAALLARQLPVESAEENHRVA